MDLRYLKEFTVLERIRNYTRAAEELYIAETTLSRHIKALEQELKMPLFQRTTRRIALTEFGQRFLVYALKIVQTMEECEAELLNEPTQKEKFLMIGVFGVLPPFEMMERALQFLSVEHPEYIVGTVQGGINEQKDKISNRKYNLAIVRESSGYFDDQFERLTLLREPLCVICSKDDILAKNETVEITALNGRSVTLASKYMLAHRLFLEHCKSNGTEPNIAFLMRGEEFVQNFVSFGSGVTVMSKSMAAKSVNPITQVIREIFPPIYEYVNLLYLRSEKLSGASQDAVSCFKKAIAEANQTNNL